MRYRLACALVVLALSAPVSAQFESVGTISFPTSGSPQAQPHFLRGVAILHSFGWKQAIAEFKRRRRRSQTSRWRTGARRSATTIRSTAEQDGKNPRAVLARLGPDTAARLAKAPTPREKGFLAGGRGAVGRGRLAARRVAYMQAMERLHKQFPDDDEVTTFYALSLLSGARALDDNTFRPEMQGRRAGDGRRPAQSRSIRARRTTSSTPSTIRCTRRWRSTPRSPTPRSSRRSRTPSTCRRTSSSSTACGTRWRSQNMRAFDIAKELWQPGDSPAIWSHSRRLGAVRVPAAGRLRWRAEARSRVRGDGRDAPSTARGRRRWRW